MFHIAWTVFKKLLHVPVQEDRIQSRRIAGILRTRDPKFEVLIAG